jgi:bromodomain adjacent to zinc finger domain protein 1A
LCCRKKNSIFVFAKLSYFAKIVEILPRLPHEYQRPLAWSKPTTPKKLNGLGDASSIVSNSDSEEEANIPRQPDGRLRFPDAFLHPTPQSPTTQSENGSVADDPHSDNEESIMDSSSQYKVQLIDEAGQPLEDCTRIVEGLDIKREKHTFNRPNVQSFIRECAYKDNYANAPWLIRV